ncbi:hypothetical protein PBI_SCTP2_373 [Salicola phage SCTP-2]|nr:hypothetical protein PBI_SCTP2_373 [Salicola phage SCTP-2]
MRKLAPTTGAIRTVKRFQFLPKTLPTRMYNDSHRAYYTRYLEFVKVKQKCFNIKDGWEDDKWYDV